MILKLKNIWSKEEGPRSHIQQENVCWRINLLEKSSFLRQCIQAIQGLLRRQTETTDRRHNNTIYPNTLTYRRYYGVCNLKQDNITTQHVLEKTSLCYRRQLYATKSEIFLRQKHYLITDITLQRYFKWHHTFGITLLLGTANVQ